MRLTISVPSTHLYIKHIITIFSYLIPLRELCYFKIIHQYHFVLKDHKITFNENKFSIVAAIAK